MFFNQGNLAMYNKITMYLFLILTFCKSHGMELQPLADHLAIKIRKELFYFFAPQMCSLWGVKQTTYNEETQMATCWFRQPRDINKLLDEKKVVRFLNKNKTPRWYKKDTQLIFTAFIKLEQLMDTQVVGFNKELTGVILKDEVAQVKNEGVRVLINSIKKSTRICAKIAGIPFLA